VRDARQDVPRGARGIAVSTSARRRRGGARPTNSPPRSQTPAPRSRQPRAESRRRARRGLCGSLNLTLADARDLGAAIDCDFYFTGEADTLRRTSTTRPDYFESYASLFLVSAKDGRLVLWEHFASESNAPGEAEKSFLAELRARSARYDEVIGKTHEDERSERPLASSERGETGAFEDVPEEGSPAASTSARPNPTGACGRFTRRTRRARWRRRPWMRWSRLTRRAKSKILRSCAGPVTV
jgi:hypothetical protein